MRRTIAIVTATAVVGALMAPAAAAAVPDRGEPDAVQRAALRTGLQVAPKKGTEAKKPAGANPYLALLPDPAKADYAGWRRWMDAQAGQRAAQRAALRAPASPLLVDEDEPDGTLGANDRPVTGQRLTGFGTRSGQNSRARVLGTLSPEQVTPEAVAPNAEDDGAIPLAGDTGIGGARSGVTTSARIGDGPHGSAAGGTGDFDFYKITAEAGESVTVDVDTPTGSLDSVVALFTEAGEIAAINDDSAGELDSLLTYQVPEAGTYYAMVTGFAVLPSDPTDPASGSGAESEGPYNVTIKAGTADVDFFAVRLRKGDVIGTSVTGSPAKLTIYDTVPREAHGSGQDASFIYPTTTPLPGGGNAVSDYVADRDGWHTVSVSDGAGTYDITVEAFRPALDGKRKTQTLFLDFDGARLNTAVFGGPGVRTLSPLGAFLAKWGLTRDDEDALIDTVVATVRENIRQDLIASGLNSQFAIKILNSRDHADPFGDADVSRIIVGGTIDESGVPTIGIAQSIDPGNFETEETALVLLDVLSEPSGDDASLNTYMTADTDRVAFVGRALGNVTAHEAGHFFGDWHVDQFNDHPDLMDQGGNFPVMFAVGPDNIGGTADDTDVDFGEDTFNPGEGFTGTENTLGRIVFGVTR